MPIVVEAVSEPEYRAWIAEKQAEAAAVLAAASQEWSKEDLIAKGEQVYQTNCVACHGATGAGIPGVFPAVAGSSIVNGDQAGHIDILLNGVSGSSMAAFRNQLSDVDIAAVITYKRNSFGNTVNDVVQPSLVKESR